MNFQEIRDYLERNNEPNLAPDELDHVAMCCNHIMKWYYEDYPIGDFLTAVVRNDLTEAVLRADDINTRALKLYAWFLTWNLPADWRKKGQGKKREQLSGQR
jgi:hypothetical protein